MSTLRHELNGVELTTLVVMGTDCIGTFVVVNPTTTTTALWLELHVY